MEKQSQLEEYLSKLQKVAITYSGGIDSSIWQMQ